jgi:hypothetical protein
VIRPINFGDPTAFTIVELAGEMLETTGSASKLELLPFSQDDPTQLSRSHVSKATGLTISAFVHGLPCHFFKSAALA